MIQINFNGFVPQYNAVETIGNLGDNKSETIHFVFNKVIDGIDISKLSCRCSYLNAEETGDVLILEPQVEGNKVTYVWVVEKNATAVKGKLQWQLSFLDAETGYTKNTNVCKFKIGDAINVEEVIDVTPTLFQQLVEQCTIQADRAEAAADAIEEDVTTIKNTLTEVDERVTEAEDLLEQSKTNAEEIQGIRDEIDATKSAFDLQYEDIQQIATEVEEAKTEATTQADNAKTSAEEAAASAKRAAETAAGLESFVISKVDALPETGEERTMYLVPCEEPEGNNYFEEYLWFEDTGFEYVGSTKIDLSGYALKTDKLASPEALTIINKNSSISYDGSESKTLDLSDVSGDQVYIGDTEPTSDNVLLWIDTNEDDDDEPIYGVYADDSDKLGGIDASEYATKSYVDSTVISEGAKNIFVGTTEELNALTVEAQQAIEMFVNTDEDYTDDETFVTSGELNKVIDGTTQVGDSSKLGGKSADSYYNLGIPIQTIPSGADLNDYIEVGKYFIEWDKTENIVNMPDYHKGNSTILIVENCDMGTGYVKQTLSSYFYLGEITSTRYTNGTDSVQWQRVAYTDNISNPNLLINGDFRVNQRGASSYSGFIYTVDMWRTATTNDKADVLDNGVRFTTSAQYGGFIQHIEDCTKLRGKTVTLSMKISAFNEASTMGLGLNYNRGETPYAFTVPFTSIGNGFITITVDLPNDITNMYVYTNKILNDGIEVSVDIEYIKLEVGRVATPNTPRPYAEELALCQRYLLPVKHTSYRATAYTTTNIEFSIPTSTSLRTTPTLIGGVNVYATNWTKQTDFTFTFYVLGGVIKCIAAKSGHGLTDATLQFDDNTYLSCEL